ncbi:MFS transporter [Rhodoferax sp.]|uniref:MFS transporter n=1 Tax=Rhodoferax sp. TaxID=50421 RepID=UPI00374D73A3
MSVTAAISPGTTGQADRRRSFAFWTSAAVVGHTLWTSAAPSLAYQIYAQQWHLSSTTTTALFAVYPVVVVVVLLVFGNLSDVVGRRAAMMLGVGFSIGGVALFAAANDLTALFAGRVLMGVGVGLSAGPSTAALIDFSPARGTNIAATTATVAQATGMSAALLLSGALIQYAPWPTRLSFIFLTVLLAALLSVLKWLPRHRAPANWSQWRPSKPVVTTGDRRPFIVATASITTAYTHGALLLALGGQIMHDLIGSSNVFGDAALLALFPMAFGAVGLLTRKVVPLVLVNWGAFGSFSGMALLTSSVALHSWPLMVAAVVLSGAGYSAQVSGGLGTLATTGSSQHRGGILSAVLLVAYLAMGSCALLFGVIATRWGLALATDIGALTIACLSATAWVLANFRKRSALPNQPWAELPDTKPSPFPSHYSKGASP